ncbi:hypothetical protein, partial [Bacteroides sp. OM05-12]|uniref:hypothetical protein n=1 Tax=Bacteroides sp. OM05-12 TaxID=2292283 RepID=UPI001F1902F8
RRGCKDNTFITSTPNFSTSFFVLFFKEDYRPTQDVNPNTPALLRSGCKSKDFIINTQIIPPIF